MSEDITNKKHHFSLRVYYEDTDAGGIVFYANYLKFVERARTEWLRDVGINQSFFLERKIGFVVRNVEMSNVASARLDDQLTVISTITQIKRATMTFSQEIYNQNNIKLCTVEVLIVCVELNQDKLKACSIPQEILGALTRGS